MTKGQAEAKISEAVSKFEIEYMGRGPKQIRTMIIQDLIIIRLKGFLSQSEQKLAENSQGVELLKKVRMMLFENSRSYLDSMIKEIVDVEVISTHSDVSTKTGEKIIVITVGENLEEKLLG
ncbi:MAG: Na-translocating system protein MpsC family protein [Saccharofermentanales bacterium]